MIQTITPEEILKIRGNVVLLTDLQWARAFTKQFPFEDDPHYNLMDMIATAFCAGKIQGIREERSKKQSRHKKEKALALTANQSTRERA